MHQRVSIYPHGFRRRITDARFNAAVGCMLAGLVALFYLIYMIELAVDHHGLNAASWNTGPTYVVAFALLIGGVVGAADGFKVIILCHRQLPVAGTVMEYGSARTMTEVYTFVETGMVKTDFPREADYWALLRPNGHGSTRCVYLTAEQFEWLEAHPFNYFDPAVIANSTQPSANSRRFSPTR